ncbi:MAG TPA: hypothetical protein VN643_15180 [Pyrinomonadaceae bacterium]|nr:hypothetical protein [Pyrinomonadaceae bacterium]
MDDLTRRVLQSFRRLRQEELDLHELFEAGGNDPAQRAMVLDTIERLVNEGLMEEHGSDFYSLTETGKEVALNLNEDDLPQ